MMISQCLVLLCGITCLYGGMAIADEKAETSALTQTYFSLPWNVAMNVEPDQLEKKYPDKKTVTPATVRDTLNEYYVPQVSDVLVAGVDYIEWISTLDDPYLTRYDIDLSVDPAQEQVELKWKSLF